MGKTRHKHLWVLACFVLAGCGDPPYSHEIYEFRDGDRDMSRLILRTTSWHIPRKYPNPPAIRFIESSGIVWELEMPSNVPGSWRLCRYDPNGVKQTVHPVRTYEGMQEPGMLGAEGPWPENPAVPGTP